MLIGYLLGVESLRAGKQALMSLTKDAVHVATTGYAAGGSTPAPSAPRAVASRTPNGYKAPKSKTCRPSWSSPKAVR